MQVKSIIQAKMEAHTEHFSFSACLYFIVNRDEIRIWNVCIASIRCVKAG